MDTTETNGELRMRLEKAQRELFELKQISRTRKLTPTERTVRKLLRLIPQLHWLHTQEQAMRDGQRQQQADSST